MVPVSEWNFCPHCGHRLYQHNGEGCTHMDIEESYERVTVPISVAQRVVKEIPCDCKHPHPLMAAAHG